MRSTGIFALAGSTICFIIAIERYLSRVATAKEIADRLQGVEFESVAMPIESSVTGLAGVLLLILGARLIFDSTRKPVDDGLIS